MRKSLGDMRISLGFSRGVVSVRPWPWLWSSSLSSAIPLLYELRKAKLLGAVFQLGRGVSNLAMYSSEGQAAIGTSLVKLFVACLAKAKRTEVATLRCGRSVASSCSPSAMGSVHASKDWRMYFR